VGQLVEGLDFSIPHTESGVDAVCCTSGVERPALDDHGERSLVAGEAHACDAETAERGDVRGGKEDPSVVSIHHHDEHRHAFLLELAESVCRRG